MARSGGVQPPCGTSTGICVRHWTDQRPLAASALPCPAGIETVDFASRYAPDVRELRSSDITEADMAALLRAVADLRRAPTSAVSRTRASEVLRIGMTGDYPPFSSQWRCAFGADVDIAVALAAALMWNHGSFAPAGQL